MIRCKKCGKTLPNDAKFCSNCGVSFSAKKTTSKSTAKKNDNRKNASTKRSSYDRYRKQQMRAEMIKRKRKRNIMKFLFWVIIIAIAAAVVGGFYANSTYKQRASAPEQTPVETISSEAETTLPESDEETIEIEEPEPTQTSKPVKTNLTLDEKAQEQRCLIYEDASYEFKCAYPESFVEGTLKNNNTRASFADESGGAEMLINFEKIGKSDTPQKLMEDYIEKIGVEPDVDNYGDNFFSITFTRGGRIYHRKAIVLDEKYIYYDFMYDQGSDNRIAYEDYIDFMDMYLEQANKK